MCEPSCRAGSVGADSKQAASRVQKKRRIRDDELKDHIHQEKLEELEQQQKSCTVYSAGTTNKGVWYLQEAEMNMCRRQLHREVAMMWQTEKERYADGGLLSGVVLARSHVHPSSTLYFGIVILCTGGWVGKHRGKRTPFWQFLFLHHESCYRQAVFTS